MVYGGTPGHHSDAGANQSALVPAISCKQRCVQHAGVLAGIRLQKGTTHGTRERMQDLVRRILLSNGREKSVLEGLMGAKFCLTLVAFCQLCAVAVSQDQPVGVISPSSAGSATYITHVTVIDTKFGKEVQDRTVIISGDRISEVRDSKGKKPPAHAKVVDGRGKYLIPGLWDMHVHAVFAERLDSMLPMFVANGVLGIRDMGTSMPLADIDHLRKGTANGSRLGPRIVAAGPLLDGHPKPMRPNFLAITKPEEGQDAVRRLKRSGSDFIKVYSWLSRDSFLAIAEEANKQNIPFAGHAPFSVSAVEASDAGQK